MSDWSLKDCGVFIRGELQVNVVCECGKITPHKSQFYGKVGESLWGPLPALVACKGCGKRYRVIAEDPTLFRAEEIP